MKTCNPTRRIVILVICLLMALLSSVCAAQTVTTIAGGLVGDGRPATQAAFQEPVFVLVDKGGNAYVSDFSAHRIRKIAANGVISTYAGNGNSGYSGDGGPASSAMLSFPTAMTFDPSGNIVFADGGNSVVRKIDKSGTITTIAGNGVFGYSGDGGLATKASLEQAWGVVYDSVGNLYISDVAAQVVREVNTGGIISTIAGNGIAGFSGDGGPAPSAELMGPRGLTVDPGSNSLYIADGDNHRVRRVQGGTINTIAGNGQAVFSGDGGPATKAAIGNPRGLTFFKGTLFIANAGRNRVRTVSPNGIINTFAGSTAGYDGDNHPPLSTQFRVPFDALPLSTTAMVFTDKNNARVRLLSGGLVRTVAGGFLGDGGAGTSASLVLPENLAFDHNGNVYIADAGGERIRKVDTTGKITTVAGNGISGYSGDGGLATAAELHSPLGVAVDTSGDIFIADFFNGVIREVDTSGMISTFASDPDFLSLQTLAFDGLGNLYAADSGNCVVWKVTPPNISVIAGVLGVCGYNGDNMQATTAQLNLPSGIAFDALGNLYIADSNNNRIRQVNTAGTITTAAGDGNCGFIDNVPPTSGELCFPTSVSVGGTAVYIADEFNYRIRKVANHLISTIAGNGIQGYNGDGLPALSTDLEDPVAVAVNPRNGSPYLADDLQTRVRQIH